VRGIYIYIYIYYWLYLLFFLFLSNDVIVSNCNHSVHFEPLLRWLVVGLPLPITGLNQKSLHVKFVTDEVALAQVPLRALPFEPLSIIPPTFHIHSLT
jgi:hypothetical protein